MKKRTQIIIATFLSIFVILIAGIVSWKTTSSLIDYRQKYINALSLRYAETGDTPSLLQLTLLSPNSENVNKSKNVLIVSGDYKTAKFLNNFAPDDDFELRVAEAALFNRDQEIAEKYLSILPAGDAKQELLSFQQYLDGAQTIEIEEEPKTDAGKLLEMVTKKDFSLYGIKYTIGRAIRENNTKYTGLINNILENANSLAELGYPFLALETLSVNPGLCNKDYFLLKVDIYDDLQDSDSSVTVIEQGLTCDSANIDLLNRAVEHYLKIGNTSKSEFYQQRINYLQEISQ